MCSMSSSSASLLNASSCCFSLLSRSCSSFSHCCWPCRSVCIHTYKNTHHFFCLYFAHLYLLTNCLYIAPVLSPLVVHRWSSSPGKPFRVLMKMNGTSQGAGELSAHYCQSQCLGTPGCHSDRKARSHLDKYRYNRSKPKASSLSTYERSC